MIVSFKQGSLVLTEDRNGNNFKVLMNTLPQKGKQPKPQFFHMYRYMGAKQVKGI